MGHYFLDILYNTHCYMGSRYAAGSVDTPLVHAPDYQHHGNLLISDHPYIVDTMVLILGDNSEHVAHA